MQIGHRLIGVDEMHQEIEQMNVPLVYFHEDMVLLHELRAMKHHFETCLVIEQEESKCTKITVNEASISQHALIIYYLLFDIVLVQQSVQ